MIKKKTETTNEYFSKHWLEFVEPLREKMLDYDIIWNSMGACGALRTAEDAKLDSNFYKDALKYGRFIRDRYTCLLYTSPSTRDKRQSRMPASA